MWSRARPGQSMRRCRIRSNWSWRSRARLLIADIVKTLSQIGARNSPRLWIVTRGAQQLDAGDAVTLAQTSLRGSARVLTFEHPELEDDDR